MSLARPTDTQIEDDLSLVLERLYSVHRSWKRVADALQVSQAFLCDLRKGRRQPGPKLLDALGLKRKVEYVRRQA